MTPPKCPNDVFLEMTPDGDGWKCDTCGARVGASGQDLTVFHLWTGMHVFASGPGERSFVGRVESTGFNGRDGEFVEMTVDGQLIRLPLGGRGWTFSTFDYDGR